MTPTRLKRAMPWIAVGLATIVMVAAVVLFVQADDRQTRKADREETAQFNRANTICGGPPIRIKEHGSGWSWGPWIEVFCQDGTSRAVR